jgi:hypothetical protein
MFPLLIAFGQSPTTVSYSKVLYSSNKIGHQDNLAALFLAGHAVCFHRIGTFLLTPLAPVVLSVYRLVSLLAGATVQFEFS